MYNWTGNEFDYSHSPHSRYDEIANIKNLKRKIQKVAVKEATLKFSRYYIFFSFLLRELDQLASIEQFSDPTTSSSQETRRIFSWPS